jgi:hypothetical protein
MKAESFLHPFLSTFFTGIRYQIKEIDGNWCCFFCQAKDNRKHLFHMLSEYLLRKNRYTDDKSFISTTAEIFQAFFFFIYRETETLTEEYRNSLIELFHSKPSQKDSVETTFTRLVMENREKITDCIHPVPET